MRADGSGARELSAHCGLHTQDGTRPEGQACEAPGGSMACICFAKYRCSQIRQRMSHGHIQSRRVGVAIGIRDRLAALHSKPNFDTDTDSDSDLDSDWQEQS